MSSLRAEICLFDGIEQMRWNVLGIASLFFLALVSPAAAYIDPGSGSVVTTAIIGFFAAIAYTARKYFYRVKDFLTGRSRAKDEPK